MGGCFAGEVPGVELGDGGVEVVEVERDELAAIRWSVVIDLDDVAAPSAWNAFTGRSSRPRGARTKCTER